MLISVCIIIAGFLHFKEVHKLYSIFKLICIEVRLSIPVYHFRVIHHFLGKLENLRKATIGLVMSVLPSNCLSVRIEQLGSQWTDFHKI